ncbi:MAG: NADH-dependent [FeFe] hydrogenase, group A6 [Smithellaceae bacterium]|nr:[FeFe] hydrogenase, group A [Syntrophaceae bacterium]MDD4240777.1 NADH-dependent [FeFe] hydrogenase, group A6 [Smithellaceae bacterium]NLX51770.1 2Fe-2S iron-sulfur cluster binding domain-containing protein [Deltaproteobacteria bacterium]
MSTVKLTIDNRPVEAPAGATILEAARSAGIKIPTLCAWPEIHHTPGACRVCMTEVEGQRSLIAACVFPVSEGMVVRTNTEKVRKARKMVVELLLANHPQECNFCVRNGSCELQKAAEFVGLKEVRFPCTEFPQKEKIIDRSSPSIVRDNRKCIECHRCVTVCDQIQTVSVLTPAFRGSAVKVTPAFDLPLIASNCVACGQCILACPVGALYEKDDVDAVWAALQDPAKHVIVQEAPAIRAALGEEFGMPPGSLVTGKMTAALRRLGFDKVFDTNFTADLTIIEEGNELLKRVKEGGTLPMITSCSPGWIKFCEHFYPDLLPHLSTCKSPQQMFGALAKTYYAEFAGIDPKNIVSVSIMPCTAKKFEAQRPEMAASGYRDVDYVLTTRELGRMIREAGIDFENLADEDYDAPMGEYTGAGTIFGATGGVMEAALRTVYAVVTGGNLPNLDITPVRGLEGVKEATVKVGALGDVNVAVAHGLGNARKLLDKIREGKADYAFIEVMCCPGGCIAGGGEPIPTNNDIRLKRSAALYADDGKVQKNRQSHENESVKKLYDKFLKEPLGHKSHDLLHTHYTKRGTEMPHGQGR